MWLWWTAGSRRIDMATRSLLDRAPGTVCFSAASGWEIAIKHRLGKLPLPDEPDRYVPAQTALQGLRILDVTMRHALMTASLPPIHEDPFDRVLVAQAICENFTLVTADAAIANYPVAQLRIA